MQLEELQQQWRRLEQKLDQTLALEAELVRRVVMQPARRRVNRLAIWPAIDAAFCIVALLVGASFMSDHWRDWHVAAPAVAVIIGLIALLVSSIRQLQRVEALDWSGPVAEIQGSLEKLRVARIRQFKWIILLSPLMGFCALMVGLHWLFEWLTHDRVNLLEKINLWWIVGNYAFGVLFVPLGWLIAGVLEKKCHGHRWWQAVLDDISGSNLKAAAQDVEHWAGLTKREPLHGE